MLKGTIKLKSSPSTAALNFGTTNQMAFKVELLRNIHEVINPEKLFRFSHNAVNIYYCKK